MNHTFFKQLESHLNAERLAAYREDGVDDATGLARYLLNMALCEALYSPLQMAEISLSNALHESLSTRAKTDFWFDAITLPQWQADQVQEAKRKLQKARKPETPGRIVAAQTFGFWVGFFTKPHKTTGLAYYLAKTAFAHAPKVQRDADKLSRQWQKVRDLRNRVFHHERIIHWRDLQTQHNDLLELIEWMNPELAQLTQMLDRFTDVRSTGLRPWHQKLTDGWPANTPEP
jgi:hypothetical protein